MQYFRIISSIISALVLLIGLLSIQACTRKRDAVTFYSPEKVISIEISDGSYSEGNPLHALKMSIFQSSGGNKSMVLPRIDLGLAINGNNLEFPSLEQLTWEVDTTIIHYSMLHGKQREIKKKVVSASTRFVSSGYNAGLTFKLMDDGLAFRYFVEGSELGLIEETTAWHIPSEYNRWMQKYQLSYEDFYDDASKTEQSFWAYPALFHNSDTSIYFLLSESDVTSNTYATRLQNIDSSLVFKTALPEVHEMYTKDDIQRDIESPWYSPWKVMAIGNLEDVFQTTLVTDFARETSLESQEWIKPGKVSWVYWANNHGSKDYKIVKEYIDLAVEMKWPYVLIDWEWDEMSNGGDIEDAISYAISKGVNILLWYNSGSSWLVPTPVDRLITQENRLREFEWLRKMGVSGIKVDFFAGDIQPMMRFYEDILIDAGKYELMVNFHGSTIPRGWQRTYPHMMSMEAVYGAEWYNNDSLMTTKAAWHNTILPFTRNTVGPMDYTPVAFTNSQHPHKTTFAHELALPVIFESALQHFADRPAGFLALGKEARQFLMDVPVVWDESRLLMGYPGKHLVVIRRHDQDWYIGGLNGTNESIKFHINLDFMEDDVLFTLFSDGNVAEEIVFQTLDDREFVIECLPMGGFVGYSVKNGKPAGN